MFFKFTTSLLITVLLCSMAHSQQINWTTDLEAAKSRAASENKLILLHFTAEWCGGCQQLETFVFNNISVAQSFNSNVIPVKIDVDLNPDLVAEYGVKGIPFDVAVDARGAVAMQNQSPKSREEYLAMLRRLGNQTQSTVAANNNPVQRQLVEHLSLQDQQQDPGLKFNSDQIDFRPSKTTIDPLQQTRTSDFQPSDFRPQAAPQLSTDFRSPTVESNSFAARPGFTQNPSLNRQPAPTAQQTQVQPPQQSTEIVRSRAKPQRILNQMVPDNQSQFAPGTTGSGNDLGQSNLGQSTASIHSLDNNQNANARNQQMDMAKNSQSPDQMEPEMAEPPTEPEFALSGNCPVTLLSESKWVKGNKQWGCVHRGRVYIFASQAKLGMFLTMPDKYSPILAGFDPVEFHDLEQLKPGRESLGVFMSKAGQQKVVLFTTPENRAKFQAEPKKYLEAVRIATQRLDQDMAR